MMIDFNDIDDTIERLFGEGMVHRYHSLPYRDKLEYRTYIKYRIQYIKSYPLTPLQYKIQKVFKPCMTQKEIADKLNITIGEVATIEKTALEKIRKFLEERGWN